MREVIARLLWFALVATILAYAVYFVVGSIVSAEARGAHRPLMVRDELGPGAHHLSGMVMVPTPCDELLVHTYALSTTTYVLSFKTWREPSVVCTEDETPRAFRTILFAPATGVDFTAIINGIGLPIIVLPAIASRR